MKKTILLTGFLSYYFLSCDKKNSEESNINIENFSVFKKGTPEEEHLNDNDTLVISAKINSVFKMSSCKIDIHFGEGHTHSRTENTSYNKTRNPSPIIDEAEFTFSKTIDISDLSYDLYEEIIILNKDSKPSKSGEYHVILTVIDEKGTSKNENKTIHINEPDDIH